MSAVHKQQMGEQVIACPHCKKHINFSVIELTVDKEVKYVQEDRIAPDDEHTIHKTNCPAGHTFWYAAAPADPFEQ